MTDIKKYHNIFYSINQEDAESEEDLGERLNEYVKSVQAWFAYTVKSGKDKTTGKMIVLCTRSYILTFIALLLRYDNIFRSE
jgi:hypothetical protein